jgi:hypothetical protein
LGGAAAEAERFTKRKEAESGNKNISKRIDTMVVNLNVVLEKRIN